MRRLLCFLLFFFPLAFLCRPVPQEAAGSSVTREAHVLPGGKAPSPLQGPRVQAPASVDRFLAAYPHAGLHKESTPEGLFLVLGDTRFLFCPTAGCPDWTPDQPGDPPLCAVLAQPYPAGAGGRCPAPGFEPGRVRHEALLKALYGATEAEVRQACVPVVFLGEELRFNVRQGAAAALARVGRRLEGLIAEKPGLADYILPTAGNFFWRTIARSRKLSAHSFGIALDLNLDKGPYWQWSAWDSPEAEAARRAYPQAIVDAFEAEGFIWGGKWHSFDFMHFEYRPELPGVCPALDMARELAHESVPCKGK